MGREFFVIVARFRKQPSKSGDRFERVDPQRINLHGLSRAGRHHPVADFSIHPSELDSRTTGIEQPVGRVRVDAVAGARDVRLDHGGENREKFLQRHGILRRFEILPDGFDIPQRGIDGVVFWLAPDVREIVGEHPAVNVARKSEKDLPGNGSPAGRERQSRQRNHGVAAPIAEPVIAGDDAAAVRLFRKAALYDELVGGKDELPKPGGRFFGESLVFRLPVMEQFHFVIRSLRAGGFNIERGYCFRGRHQRNARTGF